MHITRSALALTASCALGMLPPPMTFAADLTIAATSVSSQKRSARPEARQAANGAKNRKRAEKNRQPKISTYSLLKDPAFRHGTGISGKPRFGAADGMGLGTGIEYVNPENASPRVPDTPSSSLLKIKTDPAMSTGSFDCRDKAGSPAPGRREMTACYVHKLDKSWKTQTYVSKRSADGNTAWGGGLAVWYDY